MNLPDPSGFLETVDEKPCRNNTAVSLIFIDNFDAVTDSLNEIKYAALTDAVDRIINSLAQKVDGIVKKFEKDKYVFIFCTDKIEYLKQKKFEILEQARNIKEGNHSTVTLSMGIGVNGETLAQSMEYARAAIDLALGRGGDQVLIKDRDKYNFFGGSSRESGGNAEGLARVKIYAFKELVREASNVLVMGHRKADLDCIGSAIGVYKIVSSLDKPVHIVFDNVSEAVRPLMVRLHEFKEYDSAFISGQDALTKVTNKTLLVIVDTHRPGLLEFPALLPAAKNVVIFDHHRKSAEFIQNAILTYHVSFASSTCELVTEMLQQIPKIKLMPVEADALLSGITVDTKNFAFKTGARTFEAAAFLLKNGADAIRVRMLMRYDMRSYKAKAIAVEKAEIFNNTMAITVCPEDTDNPTLTAALAADELINISGIEASFVLSGEDNIVFVSARSIGTVNVQMIMEKLGGGGHFSIAGCQLIDTTIEDAKIKVIQAVDEYMNAEQYKEDE